MAACRRSLWGGCWLLLVLLLVGCRHASNPSRELWNAMDSSRAYYATNLLAEGDVISLTFENNTNLNTIQKIPLDGVLNLQFVGRVKVVDKTPQQLETELLNLYKPYAKVDLVTVRLVSAAASIYVTGAVLRPGKMPLDRPTSLLEAVMEAGGFDYSRARLNGVMVFRVENGMQQSLKINVKDLLEGRNVSVFYMKPFDIVYVPMKTFNF